MAEIDQYIKGLKKGDRKTQYEFYETYKGLLMSICRRYIKRTEEAEEVLSSAFVKIFTQVKKFKGAGSFEGWVKRITVNEALMHLRSQHNFIMHIDHDDMDFRSDDTILEAIHADHILQLMDQMPNGYRTVFNLYVVEGYKHREIAEMLDISIHTSKTQYMMAKKKMIELLKKNSVRNEAL